MANFYQTASSCSLMREILAGLKRVQFLQFLTGSIFHNHPHMLSNISTSASVVNKAMWQAMLLAV